jgi:hypothetical protein
MCSSCANDELFDSLAAIREAIYQLDAKAADMTKEELVEAIEELSEEMWDL